ncbi:hypothetical protein FI667_g8096, partial [Globisporangium splendens]
MSVSSSALRVGDLFNAQAAEATYQRLVDFLNQQAQHVQRLDEQLCNLTALQQVREAQVVSGIDTKLSHLDQRLTHVENRVAAIEQHNSAVDACLAKLEKAVLQAVQERKAMQSDTVRLEQKTTKMIFQVLFSIPITPRPAVNLRSTARLQSGKASRMDALVVKINAFAPKSEQLFAKTAAFDAKLQEISTALRTDEARLRAHDEAFDRVQVRVKTTEMQTRRVEMFVNDQAAHQLADHSTKLRQIDAMVGDLSTKASTNEAAQRTLSGKFHSVATAFAEQLKQQRDSFQVCVNACILTGSFKWEHKQPSVGGGVQALLSERAHAKETTRRLDAIREELDEKAYCEDLDKVLAEVESLIVQCDSLEQHVRLSSRFMNWFASRGEAYEHNLEVVDTQLRQLGHNSRPEVREPFSDQVWYPRR